MIEMAYSNPFGAFNPQEFGGMDQFGLPNALAVGAAAEKMDLARPFIERMGQEQELGMQKNQQMLQEFMSPEAQATRKAKLQEELAISQGNLKQLPSEIDAKIAKSNALIENAGPEAKAKVEKARLEITELQGKQEEGLYVALAAFGQQLQASELDELSKADAYHRQLDRLKKQFPDAKVDPKLENWNTNLPLNLEILQNAFLHSIKQQQVLELQQQKDEADLERQKLRNKATLEATRMAAAASERNAVLVAGTKEEQAAQKEDAKIIDYVTKIKTGFPYIQATQNATPEQKAKLDAKIEQDAIAFVERLKARRGGDQLSQPTGKALSEQEVKAAGGKYEAGYEYFKFPDGSIKRRKKK